MGCLYANTRHLTRIITLLDARGELSRHEIYQLTKIDYRRLNDVLHWLFANKLVLRTKDQTKKYKLSSIYKKIKRLKSQLGDKSDIT